MSVGNTSNSGMNSNNAASSPEIEDASGRKVPHNVERMFETFHQAANGEFKPTFYNPFEVKHRRRTTKAQFKVLERAFVDNQKPPANLRRSLAMKLGMTPRAVQVWFQNRRAKLKSVGGISGSASGCGSPDLSRSNSSSDLSLASHNVTPNNAVNNATGLTAASRTSTLVLEGRGRANSCPNMDLPFKQLHEALFGGSQPHHHSSNIQASQPQVRPRSGSAMPMVYPPKYPQYAQEAHYGVTPFSTGVYLPPSATMVPFVYPHDLMYVPVHHHHPQFYSHANGQVPIDPSLLINGNNGGGCGGEDEEDEGKDGLDLDYFSSPKPTGIDQQHQQQDNQVLMEPMDLNGMMMGNSEAFLMSLVDDHHY